LQLPQRLDRVFSTERFMHGLKQGEVWLAAYDRAWPQCFKEESKRLHEALGAQALDIQHIGSTAIPGMVAKPIVDIAVTVAALDELTPIIAAFERAGYAYKGEYGLAGRHFFVKGDPVTHHVHVVQRDSVHWRDWLRFRDYMRSHDEDVKAYCRFKLDLAQRFHHNRDAYTEAKTPFITTILEKAGKGYA
jgi:GrpB-like predicted nucleotidyltransferase (UPF0157 family)